MSTGSEPVQMEINFFFGGKDPEKKFILHETGLGEILRYARRAKRDFSIQIVENKVITINAIPKTSNQEQIRNLKIFLKNTFNQKALLVRDVIEFKLLLIF